MKANSLQTQSVRARLCRRSVRPSVADVGQADRLAGLYADFSTARGRLSIVVADQRSARAGAPMHASTVRLRLARAVLVDGCDPLDRVAELPTLARQQAGPADAELVRQADVVASVAARLTVVLRGAGTGFRGDLPAPPALAGLAGLGPNETDETGESLFLAAENVSLSLSLAARLVLVLARLDARRGRARRLATALRARPAGWPVGWAARVVSLPLLVGLTHAWPVVSTGPMAVVVAALLGAPMMSAGRRHHPRPVVGPVGTFWADVGLLGAVVGAAIGTIVGAVASVALPHAVVLVLAVVDVVTTIRTAGRAARLTERAARGYVGFTSDHPRPRCERREHRDR